MSATRRRKKRRKHDAYYTQSWCVERLLEDPDLPFDLSGFFLEPTAGDGDIIRPFGDRPIVWTACDIRAECALPLTEVARHVHIGDFRKSSDEMKKILRSHDRRRKIFDVSISNPPFGIAEDVLATSMRLARFTCLLLRVNYLASKGRCSFLRMFPPDVFVLPNRPSFTGDGRTDATEYAWFVWPQHSRRFGRSKVLAKTRGLRH
jgi:hypothetical protein